MKKRMICITKMLAVGSIIVCMAGAMTGCGDTSSTNNPETAESSAADDTASEEEQSEEDTVDENTVYQPGDVLEEDGVTITYLSAGEYTDYDEWSEPSEGKIVVQAEFEFENTSDNDIYVGSWDFECYADGYSAEGYYWADAENLDATLSSGKKTKGTLMYEVPEYASEILLEYETNFWTEDKITFAIPLE